MGIHQVFEVECESCHRTLVGHKGESTDSLLATAAAAGWRVDREPLRITRTVCDVCATPVDDPIPLVPTGATTTSQEG